MIANSRIDAALWKSSRALRSIALGTALCLGGFVCGQLGHAREGDAQAVQLLASGETIVGEKIAYLAGAPAKVTAAILTLVPGASTGWHTHGVPAFGYILEGELTVDYGEKGVHVYRAGDALLEAIDIAHDGRNTGAGLDAHPRRVHGRRRLADQRAGARPVELWERKKKWPERLRRAVPAGCGLGQTKTQTHAAGPGEIRVDRGGGRGEMPAGRSVRSRNTHVMAREYVLILFLRQGAAVVGLV